MWDDEDNNPYGSFHRRDSETSDIQSPVDRYNRPSTPPSGNSSPTQNPAFLTRPSDLSDEDLSDSRPKPPKAAPKEGGYDSRIEQILYEHPDLEIQIVHAGKNTEGGGGYIAYTIRTGEIEVRRRYSDFASLRNTLVLLHPTLIIPPIPEKHSMADYAAKPTKAKEDAGIIELRKRMLGVFLNRCRRMKEVREDGVWWRFLDPNVSWNEVLHTPPVASIPKSSMKAPPLDPAHPTQAHQWLPVPSSSAKLRSSSFSTPSGTPASPTEHSAMPFTASHTAAGPQVFGRFPPTSQNLSESEFDPYFTNFETSTRELELLLQGSIERVNRRTLSHLSSLATDMAELGARYNAFSLSEPAPSVAAAVERVGQAVDSSYLATEELASTFGAGFAEPMRESAQFAGVVRSVLRYRILKRVQQEMTKDELARKRALLDSLERSEGEARRIEQYLNTAGGSVSDLRRQTPPSPGGQGNESAIASSEPDFSSPTSQEPTPIPPRRTKSQSTGMTNKLLGRISHAVQGIVDVDPERTRRDQIGKTKESLVQLEQALEVSAKDVKDASAGVLKDLKRFQGQKEEDLRRYMIAYAKCHLDWARKNLETWREAQAEVSKIEVR